MPDFGECETITTNKKIPLEENKRKITFINKDQNRIRKVIVDGCVIKDGVRCDFLIINNMGIEYFVELKGADINHAVKQLECTIIQISKNAKKLEKYSFIISSRCPKTSTQIQVLQTKFKRKFNSAFLIRENKFECELS